MLFVSKTVLLINLQHSMQSIYVPLFSTLFCVNAITHNSYTGSIQGVAEKSGPLIFFAIFSASVWDFNMKFYTFI